MPGQTLTQHLRKHGLSVTRGALQGLPVLLLALVPANADSAPPAPPKPPRYALHTNGIQPGGCHLKRPPHRPFRS